jgi:basic membrane protein A
VQKKRNRSRHRLTPKVVFIAAGGGLEGNRSNETAYEGIKKAQKDYKIVASTVETVTSTDYINAISKAAAGGAKLVIGTGYISAETMTKIAAKYPDTDFALLDYDKKVADNVMSLVCKSQEGAFIAGVIAALTTRTQIVGFVGGEDVASVETYEYGFVLDF